MQEANLNAASAGLLDALALVFGELGEDPQAATNSAMETMARDRTPRVVATGW
jgi:hypothetical protein